MKYMKKTVAVLLILLVFFVACGDSKPANKAGGVAEASDVNVAEIAKEAYIFGLPLVLVDVTRRQKINSGVEMNQFDHLDVFPDASFRDVVRPNVDTYYSMAFLDLTGGPVEFSLPATERYHMFQFMDAYTNVFAVPGTRRTGNKGGNFLIAGPGWTGDANYRSPTNYVWIVGRTQVNNEKDAKDFVVPLMKRYELAPLDASAPLAEQCNPTAPKGDPNNEVAAMSIEEFFNYLNCLMVINPPAEADKDILERMAKIGVAPGAKFDLSKFDTVVQNAIKDTRRKVMDDIFAYITSFPSQKGWMSMIVDGMANFGTNYLLRAHVAHFGLGANPPEEAVYLIAKTDGAGAQLNGSNRYVLRFEPESTPPVNAFWSLTLYGEDTYLAANPINRYALGDRSDLKKNADGSIDIYIQHTSPGSDMESNWLPTPAGIFDLTLRAYYPRKELLDGSWKMPGVTVVE